MRWCQDPGNQDVDPAYNCSPAGILRTGLVNCRAFGNLKRSVSILITTSFAIPIPCYPVYLSTIPTNRMRQILLANDDARRDLTAFLRPAAVRSDRHLCKSQTLRACLIQTLKVVWGFHAQICRVSGPYVHLLRAALSRIPFGFRDLGVFMPQPCVWGVRDNTSDAGTHNLYFLPSDRMVSTAIRSASAETCKG